MKKVLIISHYFTPCTLTPSQRITYWANNFKKHGIYPVILTRDWGEHLESFRETKMPFGTTIRREKNDFYEVIYVPFVPGIVDRAYLKFGQSKIKFLFYLIKVLDTIIFGLTSRYSSYNNIFNEAKRLVKNSNYERVIISGEPFQLFKLGWILRKKFQQNWIADYRDDWTTNELQVAKKAGGIRKSLLMFERYFEKKWVKSATTITSVSDLYTRRISSLVKVNGVTIENGFDESLMSVPRSNLGTPFTITYSGTLYPNQDISIIINALKALIKNGHDIRLVFLGAGYDDSAKLRIENLAGETLNKNCFVTQKLKRKEALEFLMKSHLLLSMSYGGIKGIPSSKLYEYIGLSKPILLTPSDSDVMEQMVRDSGMGFFAANSQECVSAILQVKSLYETGEFETLLKNNNKNRYKYSRGYQLKMLAKLV